MNQLANIWLHPRTSVAGLLLGIITISAVLSQQGITLGTAGTGTIVALISGVATALLGLLARDPGSYLNGSSNTATGKVLSLALLACLIPGLCLSTTGCTAAQANTVVSEINQYLPTVLSFVAEGINLYHAAGSNATDDDVTKALNTVEADLKLLQTPLSDYLAQSSSASRVTAWSSIQSIVDTTVNDADALLTVAHVKNSNSRADAELVIASIDAAAHVLDAYVSQAQSKQQIHAKLTTRKARLAAVAAHWSQSDQQMVAHQLGVPFTTAYSTAMAEGF